jgi:hypothetical protein
MSVMNKVQVKAGVLEGLVPRAVAAKYEEN